MVRYKTTTSSISCGKKLYIQGNVKKMIIFYIQELDSKCKKLKKTLKKCKKFYALKYDRNLLYQK